MFCFCADTFVFSFSPCECFGVFACCVFSECVWRAPQLWILEILALQKHPLSHLESDQSLCSGWFIVWHENQVELDKQLFGIHAILFVRLECMTVSSFPNFPVWLWHLHLLSRLSPDSHILHLSIIHPHATETIQLPQSRHLPLIYLFLFIFLHKSLLCSYLISQHPQCCDSYLGSFFLGPKTSLQFTTEVTNVYGFYLKETAVRLSQGCIGEKKETKVKKIAKSFIKVCPQAAEEKENAVQSKTRQLMSWVQMFSTLILLTFSFAPIFYVWNGQFIQIFPKLLKQKN